MDLHAVDGCLQCFTLCTYLDSLLQLHHQQQQQQQEACMEKGVRRVDSLRLH